MPKVTEGILKHGTSVIKIRTGGYSYKNIQSTVLLIWKQAGLKAQFLFNNSFADTPSVDSRKTRQHTQLLHASANCLITSRWIASNFASPKNTVSLLSSRGTTIHS